MTHYTRLSPSSRILTILFPFFCPQWGEQALLGAVPPGSGSGGVSGAVAEAQEEEPAPGGLLRHRHAAQHRRPRHLLQVESQTGLFFFFDHAEKPCLRKTIQAEMFLARQEVGGGP